VLEDAVASLGPVPGGRIVALAGPPTALVCDRAVVARVVVNLLTNALKFTDEGGRVEVTVSREGSRARVAVRDHGPGVPEEARERVFDKFWRAGRPRDQAGPSSMGLGLAFCRLAVEAHGGTISVAPADGGGSVFSFTLPGPA
jgi:signal transduction histidine kinase